MNLSLGKQYYYCLEIFEKSEIKLTKTNPIIYVFVLRFVRRITINYYINNTYHKKNRKMRSQSTSHKSKYHKVIRKNIHAPNSVLGRFIDFTRFFFIKNNVH